MKSTLCQIWRRGNLFLITVNSSVYSYMCVKQLSALHTKPKRFHGLDLTSSWFVLFFFYVRIRVISLFQELNVEERKKKPRHIERMTGNYILLLYCEVTQVKRFSDLQETSLHFLSFFILNKHKKKKTRHSRNSMIYCSSDGVKCIYSSTVTTTRMWGLVREKPFIVWWSSRSTPSRACRHRQQHRQR